MPSSSSDQWPLAKGGQGTPTQDSRGLGRVLTLLAVMTGVVALAAFFLGAFDAVVPRGAPSAAPHQR